MKNFSKLSVLFIAFVLLYNAFPMQSAFAEEYEKFYDKGRNYNQYIYPGGNQRDYNGYSTVVISAAANYYNTQGWGRERIRMWARMDTINNIYDPTSYINRIEKMNLRFYVSDSRKSSLIINATDPVENLSSWTVPDGIYTILGYLGPSAQYITDASKAVNALINQMYTSGTKVIQDTGYDWTVVFYNPSMSVANLPGTVAYNDADYKVKGTYSGASAKFQYNLPTNLINFTVWPQGQIQYSTQLRGSIVPVYYWTGAVGISHTINSQ